LLAAATAALVAAAPAAASASTGDYQPGRSQRANSPALKQVNLASDVPGLARLTVPALKNPWGAALTSTSPLWVASQGTDSGTAYSLAPGSSLVTKSTQIRVTLPGSVTGPAGLVANTGTGFILRRDKVKAPAAFIFSTLDGHIEAWSPQTDPGIGNATDVVSDKGAIYSGLAIASTAHGTELFAADFSPKGGVKVFNSAFQPVKLAAGQFRDPRLPKGYLPFNTHALGGHIFVTYDKADPATGREAVGKGIGIVDEFSTSGRFIARIATGGPLNAPWGLAIAPKSWGGMAGSLLIGNFGDGHINVAAKQGDRFAGHLAGLTLDTGKAFREPGLWSLVPGTAQTGGTNALWFTAGIHHEGAGLLGVVRP
jgi:uncharacterized protein (TIGR03118 family)